MKWSRCYSTCIRPVQFHTILSDIIWIMIGILKIPYRTPPRQIHYVRTHSTHWGLSKMVAILQTTFSNAFCLKKNFVFWFQFHRNLFPWVQLTIIQHWIGMGWYWTRDIPMSEPNIYQNVWSHLVSLGHNELTLYSLLANIATCHRWRFRMHFIHDNVIKWWYIPRHWPFVRGIHRSPVNSPHKGQWRGALLFCLICAWTNGYYANNRDAGDLRQHHSRFDVTVMLRWQRLSWIGFYT